MNQIASLLPEGGTWKNQKLVNGIGYQRKGTTTTYYGQIADGKRSGFGVEFLPSGDVAFQGKWKAGLRWSGVGLRSTRGSEFNIIWEDGYVVYKGQTQDNEPEGKGEEFWPDGKVRHSGRFHEGVLHGKSGKAFDRNGALEYAGSWFEGVPTEQCADVEVGGYVGGWKGRKYHGRGVLCEGARRYEGDFVDGLYQGKGELLEGETRYEGDWLNDKRHGHGKEFLGSELKYEGEWVEGLKHGAGKYIGPIVYVGTWVHGRKHGFGSEYNRGRLVFEGSWVEGGRKGPGTSFKKDGSKQSGIWTECLCVIDDANVWLDGLKYEGDILDGLPQGKGKLSDRDGVVKYQGEFANGQRSGQAESGFWWRNQPYSGSVVNGKPHGFGHVVDYQGSFADGERNGFGIEMNFSGKVVFKGSFASGRRHGFGSEFEDGLLVYEGGFADGRRWGDGIEYAGDRKVYQGHWENGQRHGQGATFAEVGNVVYEGQWANGKRHGRGVVWFGSKLKVECCWQRGAAVGKKRVTLDVLVFELPSLCLKGV